MTSLIRIISLSILGALFSTQTASAASLFWVPTVGEYGISKEIAADLKVDSEGVGINAGQATIRFPKDILEVKSIDKSDSVFNFWLEEPSFSNADGAITFMGGTPYGVSGASIQVIRVTFLTKSAGTATVSFSDSAVTTSDGSGANVLSKTADASFTISPAKVTPAVIPPTQIIREPAQAQGLPTRPIIHVSLYPESSEWHNVSNMFTATWELPRDISEVATSLNKEPFATPNESEGLFDNKMFQALTDGIWYLHVQFKNEKGWGPVAHYKIMVDTKTPLPFEVTSREASESDNPQPKLAFKTTDALSGLLEYQVRIDSNDLITVPTKNFKGEYVLPLMDPGEHKIVVRAVDRAGNRIESSSQINILPIASPSFTFITEKLFSNESRGLSLKGTAIPETELFLLLEKNDVIITSTQLVVDTKGNWEFVYADPLRNGTYVARIQSKDERGAKSFIVTSPDILVTGKYTTLIITLIITLIVALAAGVWYYERRREKTKLRLEVAEGDTAKVFNMIKTDVQKLRDAQHTSTPADDEFVAEKLKKNVEKMGEYIQKEIDRAKE